MSPLSATTLAMVLSGAGTLALGAAGLVLGRRRLAHAAAARVRTTTPAVPRWFREALAAVAPTQNPDQAFTAAGLAAAVAVGAAAVVAPVSVAALAATSVVVRLAIRRWLPSRTPSDAAYLADLVSRLSEIQASLTSGASLQQAVSEAGQRPGPVGVDLARVDEMARSGRPFQEAIDEWAATCPGTGADLVANALAIAGTTGTSQTDAVGAVIATLRRRQAHDREVRALASQARASAAVLVAMPIGFAVVVGLLDHRVSGFLLTTLPGWACLLGGLGLDGAGAWWMATLVRRVR